MSLRFLTILPGGEERILFRPVTIAAGSLHKGAH
jgi:hypothetical protein